MSVTLLGTHIISTGSALVGLSLISAMAISNLRKRYIGLSLYAITSLLALYFGFLDVVGISVCIVFGLLCYRFSFKEKGLINIIFGLMIFILSICLMLHWVPGFYNPAIIDAVQVSDNAPVYSQYLNFDKALVGFFLLIYVISTPPKISYHGYLSIILACSFSYGVAILLAITTGLVEYDIKLPDYMFAWILINLFVTTYAEEAFFRGFVQSAIAKSVANLRYHEAITCVSSGLLFGLAHWPAGIAFSAVAAILGTSYAYGYLRTGNILVPIIAHFFFNLIHFTVFTYQFIV